MHVAADLGHPCLSGGLTLSSFKKFQKTRDGHQKIPGLLVKIGESFWGINNRCSLKKKTYPPSTKLSPLKIGRTPKKETMAFQPSIIMCKLLVYQSVYQYFLLQNFELDPVIRLFSTPFNFSWVSHPTKVPPTKVESLLRKVQWFSELPKVVGDVIYTWNPKQPFINAWLVKQQFSI